MCSRIACLLIWAWVVELIPASAQSFGFDHINHGWTNYSTAFNATHEPSAGGDFATVASFFTPAVDAKPLSYRVIVIWAGGSGQQMDLSEFSFRVFIWSSLERFIQSPRTGDVATLSFAVPSGGFPSTPDATTRGGRPAYELRFDLASSSLTLTQCHSYLIGFAAVGNPTQSGELFVPTGPHPGLSDVTAGNIVRFGWTYLIDAGGQTIYSGKLAAALDATAINSLPRLSLARRLEQLEITWPSSAACYHLEVNAMLDSATTWQVVSSRPFLTNDLWQVTLPISDAPQWFRLKKAAELEAEE